MVQMFFKTLKLFWVPSLPPKARTGGGQATTNSVPAPAHPGEETYPCPWLSPLGKWGGEEERLAEHGRPRGGGGEDGPGSE